MSTGKKLFQLCLWLFGQCELHVAKDKHSTVIFIVHYLEADSSHQFFYGAAVLVAYLIAADAFSHVWTSKVYVSADCTSVNQIYPLLVLSMPYHRVQTCKKLLAFFFCLAHTFRRVEEGFLQLYSSSL